LIWSCSANKEGKKLHLMKNVTAHYNIYFNARELLNESELTIKKSLDDDFNMVLEIFPNPDQQASSNETNNLNEVIKKVNTIALEKYESNWLDDSYLLLARAEYLKGDYYNAVEYYSYVSLTFPKEKKNKLAAYLGQVKSDFALENIQEADSVLQLATQLKYKYFKDDLEASQTQLALRSADNVAAVAHLKKAVNFTHNKFTKIRWIYILAQLQELIDKPKDAYLNYDKIVKSNASFEMSFNANLSRIRINENSEGKKFNKIETLKKLLKEDKNREFKEQIYYQIGIAYGELKQYDKAIEYYQTSAHTIPSTVKQKGLSFLKLAELNFDKLKNYPQAQLYYDSTLQYLPKNYPNYKVIANKANNLQYLADRLTIIEQQKGLLQFANLTDEQIEAKIDELIKELQVTSASANSVIIPQTPSISDFSASNQKSGNFYFYNSAAISQGLNEFKKRWGNRKLTDNWRSGTGSLGNDISKTGNLSAISGNQINTAINRDSIKSNFLKTLPFSPLAKQISNDKIAKALYEIAIFYEDVLKDDLEASEALEALLINYPNHPNAAIIYYQLYRLLENKDKDRSENFKAQLLQKFPDSVYAKTITDPNFGKEKELLDERVKTNFSLVYALYQQQKYLETIKQIDVLKNTLGSFRELEPQFAYLNALAIGNLEKTPAFLASLNAIATNFPNNMEVTPRVKQQIDYINSNKSVFDKRATALIHHDAFEKIISGQEILVIPKVEPDIAIILPKEEIKKEIEVVTADSKILPTKEIKKEIEVTADSKITNPLPKSETLPATKEIENTKESKIEEIPKEVIIEKPVEVIFNKSISQKHFLVIDITDPKVNIAQSFSRLSQYFYSKFDASSVNLVIRVVGQSDKFIIVSGDFYSKSQVDKVAQELDDSLPKIMEGLNSKYIKFVISAPNLSLLKDRSAIEQYIKSISE
jgi:tetratricopeptide (TPR) repeat protein